jgi:hypothetical protein
MKKKIVLIEEEWSVVTCALRLAARALNSEIAADVLSVRESIDRQLTEQEPEEDLVYARVRRRNG